MPDVVVGALFGVQRLQRQDHLVGAKLRRLIEDSQEHRQIFSHRMQAG